MHRHTEYTSQEDGSKRTRIRFNLEARGGEAFVFAEVSSKMKDGEFVYGKMDILLRERHLKSNTYLVSDISFAMD
jgi:hypothetical protein